MTRLNEAFFARDVVTCARELVGATLRWNGVSGRIVETEAYSSHDDPACHMWTRPSTRKFVASHEAGDAYVYLNYGMHWMLNVLVKGPETSGFVLIRALELMENLEPARLRYPKMKDHLLGAGPGRLTRALGIEGSSNGKNFLNETLYGIFSNPPVPIVVGRRIGISQAQEYEWRFGDPSSISLSRKF